MTTTQTSKINYREADQLIDKIAEFIEQTVADRTPEEQEYVLRSLDDVVSNTGFDHGFEIILNQKRADA